MRRDEIENRMQRLQEELDVLEAFEEGKLLRNPDDLTIEEKAEVFDELHDYIMRGLQDAAKEGYLRHDVSHYIFEYVMNKVVNGNVWELWNQLAR